MKNNEFKALESIGGIDGGLIEAAGSYKKKKPNMRWLYSAAAYLALGLAVFTGVKLAGNKPDAPAGQSAYTDGSEKPSEAPRTRDAYRVIYGSDTERNEFVPGPGEVNMAEPLRSTVSGDVSAYDGSCFAVSIELANPLYDVSAALESKWQALCSDPDCRRWEEDYNYWLNEVFFKLPPEEKAEILQGHNESGEEQQALLNAEFEKYELTRMSPEEFEARRAAHERKKAFAAEELERTPEELALRMERIAAEAERLEALGLDVELSEDGEYILGFLTADELSAFPADPVYGYYIHWQGHEGIMDE